MFKTSVLPVEGRIARQFFTAVYHGNRITMLKTHVSGTVSPAILAMIFFPTNSTLRERGIAVFRMHVFGFRHREEIAFSRTIIDISDLPKTKWLRPDLLLR